jgi:hypothetical protein
MIVLAQMDDVVRRSQPCAVTGRQEREGGRREGERATGRKGDGATGGRRRKKLQKGTTEAHKDINDTMCLFRTWKYLIGQQNSRGT